MSRRGKKKRRDFFPKKEATPSEPPPQSPNPAPSVEPQRVTIGYDRQGAAPAPSAAQRAANEIAAALYAEGVDPVSAKSKAAVDDLRSPREQIVEVERMLLAYLSASFNGASLKPAEVAVLGRSIASTILTRRKIEIATSEESRRAKEHPGIVRLRELQAARLAKVVSKGATFPPKNDANEINPEAKGKPTGLPPDEIPDD